MWEKILVFTLYGECYLRARCFWCGAPAEVGVSRTSTLSGHTHSDLACHRHGLQWAPESAWER